MNHPTADKTAPYDKLYIYYFQGQLKSKFQHFGSAFIGNWEEGDTSFLFFSEPADGGIEELLKRQPHLTLEDRFCMSYDQWHGEPVQPFRAGRFLIMPPWRMVETKPDDIPIILDPGVVFGAGTHPTTRDCLEAMEILCDNDVVESSLDLGTGTGLLAIAAARLGSKSNIAVDNNYLATRTAYQNVVLNELTGRVDVICGLAQDLIGWKADLLISNIHYDVMKDLIILPEFLNKKWFILSGLLRSEAVRIESELANKPVVIIEKWLTDGVWHTLLGRVEGR